MNNLLTQIIECNDQRTIDRIVDNNIYKLNQFQRSHLTIFANNAKRRIFRINAEKKLSHANYLN
jgi:hypothetical protein